MEENLKKAETKEERFKRLATARTQRILNDLRLLGNCSNHSVYSYSKEDVARIFGAIDKELKRIKLLFSSTEKNTFRL
jgi:hypothetical protein